MQLLYKSLFYSAVNKLWPYGMPITNRPIALAIKRNYTHYTNHNRKGLFIRRLPFCCTGIKQSTDKDNIQTANKANSANIQTLKDTQLLKILMFKMGWNRPLLRYLQIFEINVLLLVCRKASSCRSFVEESSVPHSPLLKRENSYSNPPKGQKWLSFHCSKLLLSLSEGPAGWLLNGGWCYWLYWFVRKTAIPENRICLQRYQLIFSEQTKKSYEISSQTSSRMVWTSDSKVYIWYCCLQKCQNWGSSSHKTIPQQYTNHLELVHANSIIKTVLRMMHTGRKEDQYFPHLLPVGFFHRWGSLLLHNVTRTSRRISHQCQTKKLNFQCWWWCWWRRQHISMELVMPDRLTQKLSPTECFKSGSWYGMYHSVEKKAETWRFNPEIPLQKSWTEQIT